MSQAPRDQPAAGDASLTQAWREASKDEPPAALDDAIRAAARQAVRARPRRITGSPFGGRWRVPLSVAAVLVVSATVTLLVAERDKDGSRALHDQKPGAPTMSLRPDRTQEPSANSSQAPARQFAEPAAPPTAVRLAPREREWEQTLQESKDLSSPAAAPAAAADKRQAPAQSAAPPASKMTVPESARVEADRLDMARAKKEQVEPADDSPVPAAAPPMARADESSGDAAGSSVDQSVADPTKREEQTEARAKQRIAGKTLSPAPTLTPQRPQEASAPQAAPRVATAAPPAKASAESAAAPAAAESLEPKAWLDRILELRRQGKLEEADKSLKAFRERYPTYPLPPELKSVP